jgi:hypothetical protein
MTQAEALRLVEELLPRLLPWLIALGVCLLWMQHRRRWDRIRDEQSRQRQVAAGLGFTVPGRPSRDGAWDTMLASLAMGPEKLGPFPRFSPLHPRVQILFEGERDGMKAIIALHTLDSETTPPNRSTLACFVSPEIQVSAFDLQPVLEPIPTALQPVFEAIDKALKRIGWLSNVPPIEFPGRSFNQLYTLTSDFAVTIRDDFHSRVLDFFERNPGWRVEGLRGRLLVWREQVVEEPERVPAFLEEAAAVAQVFRCPLRSDD